jgi:hypothetical protein
MYTDEIVIVSSHLYPKLPNGFEWNQICTLEEKAAKLKVIRKGSGFPSNATLV